MNRLLYRFGKWIHFVAIVRNYFIVVIQRTSIWWALQFDVFAVDSTQAVRHIPAWKKFIRHIDPILFSKIHEFSFSQFFVNNAASLTQYDATCGWANAIMTGCVLFKERASSQISIIIALYYFHFCLRKFKIIILLQRICKSMLWTNGIRPRCFFWFQTMV